MMSQKPYNSASSKKPITKNVLIGSDCVGFRLVTVNG